MFVRYYVDLAAPFAEVESRLLDAPDRWVPGIFEEAEGRGRRLLGEVGFTLGEERRLDKEVVIQIGRPYRIQAKTALPITWSATGTQGLFPLLEGDLEVAGLGDRRCQLSFSARYKPPLGMVGRALDRALLHRVAEATIKDFLDRVAEAIGADAHVPLP